jgi:peptide/nickel transport system permease protein
MKSEKLQLWLYVLRRHPLFIVGVVIVTLAILMAIIGPSVVPYDPMTALPGAALQPPSREHPFGTDRSGMDVFSRVVAAARIDVSIGIAATVLAWLIGTPLGVLTGYYQGLATDVALRAADVIQAFPVMVLGMAMVAVTGQQISNVIWVMAFLYAPIYMRLVRSQAIGERDTQYVLAARCSGNSELRIAFRHIAPNCIAIAIIQASVNVGSTILLTAGLSFIGAGVRVPIPEWGSMISIGAPNIMTGEWWPAVFPGIFLSITVLGFAMIGNELRYMIDPTRR